MNKKWKIGISLLSMSVVGAGIGLSVGFLTSDMMIKENNKVTLSSNNASVITTNSLESTICFSNLEDLQSYSQICQATINNKSNHYGEISFVDGSLNKKISPGDVINIYVKNINNNYLLSDLLVYSTNDSTHLNVTKNSNGTYSFVVPYDISSTLTIEAFFESKDKKEYEMNYDNENELTKYCYELTSNSVLDDNTNNDLMNYINELKYSNVFWKETVNVTIFLNDFIIEVGSFTIPSNCNLIFLNNKNDTGNGKIIGLNKGVGKIIIEGSLTRWNSVSFEKINISSNTR